MSFMFFIILFISTFAIGYSISGFSYNVTCPECEGTGEVWERWSDWVDGLAPRSGYRICPTCHGSGQIMMLSTFGSALIFFIASMFLFLGIFGLDYFIQSWRLEWNSWVADVKEMGFWFNPMYWTWLFYHDHKKWAKWNTIASLACAIFLVTIFGVIFAFTPSLSRITSEDFWTGWVIATTLMIFFAFNWYLYYKSVDKHPSPFPRRQLSDLPPRL